jgi:protein DPCD
MTKMIAMVVDGRRRVSWTSPDGVETVEEFDVKTNEMLMKKTRKKTALGADGEWIIEIGTTSKSFDPYKDAICPNSSNPIYTRLDTKEMFQWRIRNLPYDADVFSVTIEQEKNEIVVRTSNKKYFKRIQIPEMSKIGMKLVEKELSWKHQHNTLVISYKKPMEILKLEAEHLSEILKLSLTI